MIDFLERITTNYADIIGYFAIPMVIGIFAFAFPLLLQIASRIDDKYESTLLIKVFRKDWITKAFLCILIISLVCCLLWILQLPRYVDWGKAINCLIDNSAFLLLITSTILLVISTISVVWLAYVFYLPEKLFERLKKQYTKCSLKNRPKYFLSISKIMHYSIKKSDKELSCNTLGFFINEFILFRNNKSNAVCTYPIEYYTVIEESNEIVYMNSRKETSYFNESVLLGLLLDEDQKTIISEKSYSSLWRGIRQALFYGRDEFVFAYWKKAHQYFNFHLDAVLPQYSQDFTIVNQREIDCRDSERIRFLEFHYALGGLLMMKGKYTLLSRLTLWTNQIPPKYVLVPETMYEVIERFMDVEKGWTQESICYYEQRYPFPDVSGVNAEDIIKMWIKRYIAILFLRQYTLQEYFIYSRTLEMPKPPQTLAEKKKWCEQLGLLKRFVNEYMGNHHVLEALGLESLKTPNWFENNEKKEPNALIDEFIRRIAGDIETTKTDQEIDDEKKKQFEHASKQILNRCFEKYSSLKNEIKDDEPHNSLFYPGIYQIEDKMAFASDQDITYLNSDTIVAEMVAANFRHNMPNIFQIHFNNTAYSLKKSDLFKAIDALQLDRNKYTILSIGIYLQYYERFVGNSLQISEDSIAYKNIPIIELESTGNTNLNNSLIVVKNEDIPCIIHRPIEEDIISKYKLTEIDTSNHIYTNIIDLNREAEIKEEVARGTNIQDLSQKVLVCVDLKTEVRCRTDAKCIQLKVFSQFEDQGTTNKVEDVVNIWNKEK